MDLLIILWLMVAVLLIFVMVYYYLEILQIQKNIEILHDDNELLKDEILKMCIREEMMVDDKCIWNDRDRGSNSLE